jgi:hypothetical protein
MSVLPYLRYGRRARDQAPRPDPIARVGDVQRAFKKREDAVRVMALTEPEHWISAAFHLSGQGKPHLDHPTANDFWLLAERDGLASTVPQQTNTKEKK